MKPDDEQHRPSPRPANDAHGDHTDSAPTRASDSPSADLARELTGDLPCIACGYNLRSISVLSVCPECATPVRATILARVDPYAGVLRPISAPRLVAAGLLLWSIGGVLAAFLTWGLRITDAWNVISGMPVSHARLVQFALATIAISALGAGVSLVSPHRGIPGRYRGLAIVAILAYIPFAWFYWQLHGVYDPPRIAPYLEGFAPDPSRALLRLAGAAMLLVIVIALRPNLRLLTARSIILRTGRVERQTMLGLAASILVLALGDFIHLLAAELPHNIALAGFVLGVFFIAVGSMLLTVGMAGIVIDCLRIVPVVLHPPVSRQQVLGEEEPP